MKLVKVILQKKESSFGSSLLYFKSNNMKIIKVKVNINAGDIFIVVDSKNKYQIIDIYKQGSNNYFCYQKMKNDFELHPYKYDCTEQHLQSLIKNEIIKFI